MMIGTPLKLNPCATAGVREHAGSAWTLCSVPGGSVTDSSEAHAPAPSPGGKRQCMRAQKPDAVAGPANTAASLLPPPVMFPHVHTPGRWPGHSSCCTTCCGLGQAGSSSTCGSTKPCCQSCGLNRVSMHGLRLRCATQCASSCFGTSLQWVHSNAHSESVILLGAKGCGARLSWLYS